MSSKLFPGLIAAILAAAPMSVAAKEKPVVGRPAPALTATTIDKQPFSLDALKGQVVVVNFWATWCAPCKAEMPMMDGFYKRYKQAGFEMIGITTRDSVPASGLKKLDAVLAYPLATRMQGKGYGAVKSVPTSYVIDRQGVLRHTQVGAFDEAEFNAVVLPLLAERAR